MNQRAVFHLAQTIYRGPTHVPAIEVDDPVVLADVLDRYDLDPSLPVYELAFATRKGITVQVRVGATTQPFNEGSPLYTQDFQAAPFNYSGDHRADLAAYDLLKGAYDTFRFVEDYLHISLNEIPPTLNRVILSVNNPSGGGGTWGGRSEDTIVVRFDPNGFHTGDAYTCPVPYNLEFIAHELSHELLSYLTPLV